MNSGHIHYQCEEPGYIMGLMAITPMIDYSQGNDFDLNLQTMDDLHKPALDGIGYQELSDGLGLHPSVLALLGVPKDVDALVIW